MTLVAEKTKSHTKRNAYILKCPEMSRILFGASCHFISMCNQPFYHSYRRYNVRNKARMKGWILDEGEKSEGGTLR